MGHRGLRAALRARDAVLAGDLDAVDRFIVEWLGQQPTRWRHEATVMVLLNEEDWLSDDAAAGAAATEGEDLMTMFRRLVGREARRHKLLGDTVLLGRPVGSLDEPVLGPGGTVATLVDVVPDPSAPNLAELCAGRAGYVDDRVGRALDGLKPAELEVALAYARVDDVSWVDAAREAGHPAVAERVRRKLKRAGAEFTRRQDALAGSNDVGAPTRIRATSPDSTRAGRHAGVPGAPGPVTRARANPRSG